MVLTASECISLGTDALTQVGILKLLVTSKLRETHLRQITKEFKKIGSVFPIEE